MSARMDIRRRRTRLRLHRALRDLMTDAAPEAIPVEALARRAGVTRQTFYGHYSGIPAMLEELLDELLAEMACRHRRAFRDAGAAVVPDRLQALVASVFADLDAEDPRIAALLHGGTAIDTEARLGALVEEFLAEGDPEGSAALCPSAQSAQARYFAGGFLALLRHWIALGPDRPGPQAMARHFTYVSLYGRKGETPGGARCPNLPGRSR